MLRLLVLCLLAAQTPELSLVVLKDGTALKAVEVTERETVLVVETADGGLFSVRRDRVQSIEPLAPPEPARPAPAASRARPAAPPPAPRDRPIPARTYGRGGSLSVMGSGAGPSPRPEVASPTEAETPAPGSEEERGESWWRGRAEEMLGTIDQLESEVAQLEARKQGFLGLATAMIRAGREPFTTGDLAVIESRLQTLRPKLEKARKDFATLKEEARRAGVPPGWLRPKRRR